MFGKSKGFSTGRRPAPRGLLWECQGERALHASEKYHLGSATRRDLREQSVRVGLSVESQRAGSGIGVGGWRCFLLLLTICTSGYVVTGLGRVVVQREEEKGGVSYFSDSHVHRKAIYRCTGG